MLRLGRERDQLKIVDDQIGAPTSAEAITEATLAVLEGLPVGGDSADGLYHLTCSGATSWCGFAKAIFAEFANVQKVAEVLPIPTEAYPTPAKRPRNSRLCCDKFARQFGFQMPGWEAALADVASAMLSTKQH
jgi:dTDP-4-dehydrorhamnose reductase